ncbi:ATP-binding protein [Alkanindiges sp. WGS2144]|uniref:ATP-binding protein n=1 Tax=Alkanindiges sp. WGS2144 TaxID=3366808 RepID=UPI003751EBF1
MFKEQQGILREELRLGVVASVSAQFVKVNLAQAGNVSGTYICGNRYGLGEVGEFVIIEAQRTINLGRITEVKLPERDRTEVTQDYDGKGGLDAIGFVQLLGSVDLNNLKVQAGVVSYPRLGDRVYAAPSILLALIPSLLNSGVEDCGDDPDSALLIELGEVTGELGCKIRVSPEKLFGRHCAILGSTGGGKSWTTAKIIEECAKFKNAKIIVIDATGEYRGLDEGYTGHYHLCSPLSVHPSSVPILIPPTNFVESDFVALFEPSSKVQAPKFKEAIKSLRLVELVPSLANNKGYLSKINLPKKPYNDALKKDGNYKRVDNPGLSFNVDLLPLQIKEECCRNDSSEGWGKLDDFNFSACLTLLTRIYYVINAPSFKAVFNKEEKLDDFDTVFNSFFEGNKKIFRLCLSDVSYEFNAREIISNVIGRKLLELAREGKFKERPLVVFVDEAHNFLGKKIGLEEHAAKLDAFELIAKEGRKYGLNICLTTQRPRDITEGVLSQMGTLIVHRLTNDKDREVVERACGELDRTATAFLPNLKQGEVALVGVDFPIPMSVQVDKPNARPKSDGADFQKNWN